MLLSPGFRIVVLAACGGLCVHGQGTPSKDVQTEAKGIPARATPADYQAQGKAGTVTIGADFTGHSIPTSQGPLSTEDYVVVEVGLFGPSGERLKITADDFSLRVNGKKPLPSQPFGLVMGSVKDPEWVPPEPPAAKSKTSLGGGGGRGDQGDLNAPPAPVKVPIEVQRAMAQRVQKAALPEGDRTLPQAGLIFFQYRGKTQGINSVDLMYAGPAGKTTLKLHP